MSVDNRLLTRVTSAPPFRTSQRLLRRRKFIAACVLLMLGCNSNTSGRAEQVAAQDTAANRKTANISRFDLSTRDELLYAHWVSPFVKSDDVRQWTWINALINESGKWVSAAVDSSKIASAIQEGLSIEGQQPLAKLDRLVEDCAQTLGVRKPTVIVRNTPETTAYIVAAETDTFLVLTSGLLRLFDGAEDELRFVVGRELGHLKCEHLAIRKATFGLLAVLNTIDSRVVPAEARNVLPTLLVGRMITWMREAEISADRAGLICCGRPQTAFNALARLLHGLPKGTEILDPEHPDFDAAKIVSHFEKWEHRPLYQFVTFLQQQPRAAPFIAQRLAALKLFAESDQYRGLRQRSAEESPRMLVIVEDIEVLGVADPGSGIYPYVRCSVGEKELFCTGTKPWGTTAVWKGLGKIAVDRVGQPVIFEIWNDGNVLDSQVGGFVIYPPLSSEEFATSTASILWDWKDRSSSTRIGVAHVKLRFAKLGAQP